MDKSISSSLVVCLRDHKCYAIYLYGKQVHTSSPCHYFPHTCIRGCENEITVAVKYLCASCASQYISTKRYCPHIKLTRRIAKKAGRQVWEFGLFLFSVRQRMSMKVFCYPSSRFSAYCHLYNSSDSWFF